MGISTPAVAQCAPDPTTSGGTTNCEGVDSDGLNVPTTNTSVRVAAGARVEAGTNAAAIVTSAINARITVVGDVAGGSRPGLSVTNGVPYYAWVQCDPYAGASVGFCPSPYIYTLVAPSGSASITVEQGGSISGANAVRLQRQSGNNNTVFASVDNAGSLTGTGGAALVAGAGTNFSQIENRETGVISGIDGRIEGLINAGLIDGAVSTSGSTVIRNSGRIVSSGPAPAIRGGILTIENSGDIISSGPASTIQGDFVAMVNSGQVRSNGAGAAIDTSGGLRVENEAGASIGTAGSVAIRSSGEVDIVNAGTIDGSILVDTTPFSRSRIDNLDGTINGDVRFGGGNDTLLARFDTATRRITGISGAIDGGAGVDELVLGIGGDTSLGDDAMPIGFERLGLRLEDAAVTIVTANGTSHGINASGTGRIINTVSLVTTGTAIRTTFSRHDDVLDVENRASIIATPDFPTLAAVEIRDGSFTNSGTVTSIGGVGANVSGGAEQTLTNTGTITGATTGASTSYIRLDNRGVIEATQGTGAVLYYAQGAPSTNEGTITGSNVGLYAYLSHLVNTGTISGGAIGITADSLRLDNQAGGRVSGGNAAIDARAVFGTGGSTIRNAGTIDGDVILARDGGYDYARDVFIDAGGVVNGTLRMGAADDLLVVELGGDPARPLAGVTGGIDMGEGIDTIRYVAGTDHTAAIAVPTGFDRVAYGVRDDARLKLNGASPRAEGLTFSGRGTIDVTTDITVTGAAAIDLSDLTVDEMMNGGRSFDSVVNPGLTVVSRGALSFTGSDSIFSQANCAVNAADGSFENAGSLAIRSAPYPSITAVCGGATVTNSGTITLDGGVGVWGSDRFINRGTLTDVVGSGGTGVSGASEVVNSGSIVTDRVAVAGAFNRTAITNSGLIESRTSSAIELIIGSSLVNEAGGTVRAPDVAVTGFGGDIVNRGRIVGDVDLSGGMWSPFPVRVAGRYVSDGGTLVGDLRFGAGNDVFVQSSAVTGVSGVIDGGDGFDRVVLSTSGQGRFDGRVVDFERLEVAAGEWTLGRAVDVPETGIASGATLIGTTTTLTGEIANAGTLRIDQNEDGRFGGTLTGNGALVKAGAGSVAMGDQFGFTGTTTVLAGRLQMAGRTAARLNLIGGILGGTGTVGALSVGRGGTVAPGDGGIGVLTVTGDFAQGAGSTYLANLTATGQSDRILIGGTATLAQGSRLVLEGTAGPIGTRYTLLTAAGGLTGTYGEVEQSGIDRELRIAYSADSVFADVARTARGLAGIATTGNQRAVALGLSGLTAANAAYATVTLEADDGVARASLDQLSGEAHASIGAAMVLDARIVEDAVLSRTLAPAPGYGVWGSMIGNCATDDGDANSAALHRSTFGGVGGVDVGVGEARIGLAAGYTETDFAVNDRFSNGRTRTVHALGYGGGRLGPVELRAGIGYAWSDNRVDRTIGFVGERVRADYNGNSFYSFAEAGHGFALGGGSIAPFVGFESYRITTDAFVETGGSAALRGEARSESFAFAKLGVRTETAIVHGLSARANAAWLRRVDGEAPSLRASFAGAASGFDVIGVPLSRDAAAVGLDVVWAPADNIRIVSGYNGRIGGQSEDSSFRLMASIGF